MASFDVDAFRDAHRPFGFSAGGRSFESQHVSAPAVAAFFAAFQIARTEADRARALTKILRLAFPMRLSYRWRGDPVRILLALEPAARNEALLSFFEHLEGKNPSTSLPTIPGEPSSTPKPTAP